MGQDGTARPVQIAPGGGQLAWIWVRATPSTGEVAGIETIKRTRQPYFVLAGNIGALLAAKDHVNVFLYDGGVVPDPDGIVTAGHTNKTARTVAVRRGERINALGPSVRCSGSSSPTTVPVAGDA